MSKPNYSLPSLSELPASFRTKTHSLVRPIAHFQEYLDSDLSVERIERAQAHLWAVGRPYPSRPLNFQLVLGRAIIATTEPSLHLLWTSKRIYIKALPPYFFSEVFYTNYLGSPHPHGPALGLLHSYVALIPTELDFELARDAHLLPSSCGWETWRLLCSRLLTDYPDDTIYAHIPERYVYGELRLDCLDKIYHLFYGDWIYGYSNLMGSSRYVDWFAKHFGSIAGAIAYLIVVLTAMQLGLDAKGAGTDSTFERVCYGFAIFAILEPVAVVVVLMMMFATVFFVNWLRTVAAQRSRFGDLTVEGQGTAYANSSKE